MWNRLPTNWEEGAFLGNGLMGAMVFAPEAAASDEPPRTLAFQLGRTDVTDHRAGKEPILARPRLPIGQLHIQTAGKLTGAQARLSLWDAEWSGTLRTDRGSIQVSSFIHADLAGAGRRADRQRWRARRPLRLPPGAGHQRTAAGPSGATGRG